ncbi:MAG: hypothetical protein JSS11_12120 [Verrucomicrobia bacterium]|nr:hypothetical protein [Verrucomicrobiota bacterium]
MKQTKNIKSSILAAALALGLVATATAQSVTTTPAATDEGAGLLGTNYAQLSLNYLDLNGGPPSVARGFNFAYNQKVSSAVDFNADYDWARAEAYGSHLTQQKVNFGATAYSPLEWGKAYVQVLGGWVWQKAGSFKDDSFAYTLGTGVEFTVAPKLSLTPYVNFVRATGFSQNEYDFGVKAAYRLNKEWSLTARAQYDAVEHSSDAAEYSLGAAYHF